MSIFWLYYPYLMFGHFVADFVCQTREMGNNKSKSLFWLTAHILTYVTIFGFICLPLFLVFYNNDIVWFTLGEFLIVNGILHWITDYWTSKLNAYNYVNEKEHAFWTGIGFDQWIHSTCISVTFYMAFYWNN